MGVMLVLLINISYADHICGKQETSGDSAGGDRSRSAPRDLWRQAAISSNSRRLVDINSMKTVWKMWKWIDMIKV